MTDAPLSPALLALLQIIEDLCAAIAQGTGLGLFARLLLIPVRRQLRGMAEAVSEAIAESATRAPDASPIFIPGDPAGPSDAHPNTPTPDSPDATGPASAAPVAPPPPAGAPLAQDDRAPPAAGTLAEWSGNRGTAAPRPVSDAAAAPVMAEPGRYAAARNRTATARDHAASASPPAPVARAVAAPRFGVPAAHAPPADRKMVSPGGVLRALFVSIS